MDRISALVVSRKTSGSLLMLGILLPLASYEESGPLKQEACVTVWTVFCLCVNSLLFLKELIVSHDYFPMKIITNKLKLYTLENWFSLSW